MYLTILWFSLNCLSFFELYVQDYIDSLRMKRLIRLLHLFLSCALQSAVFHLAVKLYAHFCAFPFSFGKTNYLFKIICPLLFVSTQIFLLFDCQRSCATSVGSFSTHIPSWDVRGFLLTSPSVGCRHCRLVGLDGLEPSTSRLSGARSSHLSYKPELTHRL